MKTAVRSIIDESWLYIKNLFISKEYGFYVALVSFVATFCYLFAYLGIDSSIFNNLVILYASLGIILFFLTSVFKPTAFLSPMFLVIFSFLSLLAFATADGVVDFFSTAFFSGFSLKTLFSLGVSVWLSILGIIVSFLASSVAAFLPQVKKEKKDKTISSAKPIPEASKQDKRSK